MSRTADAAVGMMDAAYFVGRKELLDFFNDLLDLNLSKIEQTAPGHVACQLTELIFPGSIPMSKVNWEAKTDYEFIQNYKLLQKAFSKHRVQRYVDVDKLIRAKYQDNLEMCQWLKAFYDQSGVSSSSSREDYDPVAVRLRGKGGKRYQEQFGKKKARGSSSSNAAAVAAGGGGAVGARPRATSNNSSSSSTNNNNRKATAAATTRTTTRSAQQPSTKPKPPTKATAATTTKPSTTLKESPDGFRHSRPLRERPSEQQIALNAAAVAAAEAEKVALEEKNLELEATVATLEEAVLEVEKERDFYFGKLRNIEVLLQVHQERCGGGDDNDDDDDENGGGDNHEKLVDDVFKILYATAEDKLHVNEHGELVEVADSLDECLDTI